MPQWRSQGIRRTVIPMWCWGASAMLEGFDASAQEDYDTTISMPRQSYTASAYWYRANLEFKTGHYYRAAEDQTEYLYFTQKENQNIKGIATQYL